MHGNASTRVKTVKRASGLRSSLRRTDAVPSTKDCRMADGPLVATSSAREVARAWERFAAGEDIETGVRPEILASWYRCRDQYEVDRKLDAAPAAPAPYHTAAGGVAQSRPMVVVVGGVHRHERNGNLVRGVRPGDCDGAGALVRSLPPVVLRGHFHTRRGDRLAGRVDQHLAMERTAPHVHCVVADEISRVHRTGDLPARRLRGGQSILRVQEKMLPGHWSICRDGPWRECDSCKRSSCQTAPGSLVHLSRWTVEGM
ncbi:hypothetical protein SUDANB54_00001 [Streptomyces sp. enrichment culture]